jgi:hypothetical protein
MICKEDEEEHTSCDLALAMKRIKMSCQELEDGDKL